MTSEEMIKQSLRTLTKEGIVQRVIPFIAKDLKSSSPKIIVLIIQSSKQKSDAAYAATK